MKRLSVLLFALVLAVGCSDPISVENESPAVENGRFTPPSPATKNLKISEIVVNSVNTTGEFSVLLAALSAAELVGAVDGRTIYTVVAPTDAAFHAAGITAENVGSLDKDFLTDVLLYHVKPGRFTAEIVLQQDALTMANGGTLHVNGATLTDANGGVANIVGTDIAARNGIIHVIDAVVIP